MTREHVESEIEKALLHIRNIMLEYDKDFEYLGLTVWRNHITANNNYWEIGEEHAVNFWKGGLEA